MMSIKNSPNLIEPVVVAQLCAQRHYAAPVALEQAGVLRHLYTDLWAGKGVMGWTVRALAPRLKSQGLKKWAGRYDVCLPNEKVTAFTRLGLEYAWRLRRVQTRSEQTRAYLWAGDTFGRLVVKRGFHGARAVYCVFGGARRIFEAAKENGLRTVHEQMSCPQLWRRLEKEERERWPGWGTNPDHDEYEAEAVEWENAELDLGDVVVCPSDFVRAYVLSLGVAEEKVRMVPYGVLTEPVACLKELYRGHRVLRVLFVGRVSLMKGAQYLLEALRRLNGNSIQARLVGPVRIAEKALSFYGRSCEILGPVPRSEIIRHYRWADIFVLPSVCEGSALVTYEALAAGLPVICTPNTGTVVRDGQDGFIVPIRDSEAIAKKIETLASDPEMLSTMSANASRHAAGFTLENYGRRLLRAFTEEREFAR